MDDFDRDALGQAFMLAAAEAFRSNDGRPFSSILGNTMYAGTVGYDRSLDTASRRRKAKADEEYKRQQIKASEQKMAEEKRQQEAYSRIFDGAVSPPGTTQSMAFTPETNARLPAPASDVETRRARYLQAAEMAARINDEKAADRFLKLADAVSEEFNTTLQYDQGGNALQVGKRGTIRRPEGIKARDKIVKDDMGSDVLYRSEYSLEPLGTAKKGPSPDALLTDSRIRSEGVLNREATATNAATANAAKSREDADNLRKEFNALPQVKAFTDIAPIFNAAAKAPDTPAGDFALIYGVGKILDPGSVVREGEMNLVMAAGSPAQRVMGYLNYLQSRGRLTPEQRGELTQMLHNAASERQNQYGQARTTYTGLATQRGYNPEEVFIGAPEIVSRQQVPQAPAAKALPHVSQRKLGEVYETPSGRVRWMGNGWAPVS